MSHCALTLPAQPVEATRAQPSTPMRVKLRADAQRLELPFACPCFSLAWARKNTARSADIGIAGLFFVGIAVLVIDRDRFAAYLAGMMMFRCSGRLDWRRCDQRRAENCDKRLSHFDLRNAGRPFPRSLLPFIQYFYVLARVIASAVKGRASVSAPVGEGISRHRSRPKATVDPRRLFNSSRNTTCRNSRLALLLPRCEGCSGEADIPLMRCEVRKVPHPDIQQTKTPAHWPGLSSRTKWPRTEAHL
jgi:hypothetical protein